MQFRKTLILGVISASLLSGCSIFGGEEDSVKVSPVPQVQSQFTPNKLWDTSVGNGVGKFYSHLRPAALGDKVYAADRKGIVAALNAKTGKAVWSVDLSEKTGILASNKSAQLSGGVTVEGDKVYVGSEKAVVYALSADNGSITWNTNVASEVLSRPVVSDGLVLIHTSNGMLQALDENDGAIKWTVNLDMPTLSLRGESAPAVAYGAAIVGSNNGRVNAIMMSEGQLIWQQRISVPKGGTEIDRLNDVNTTPVIVDNVVYALGYNGNLVAMELRSGQIIWKRDVGSVNDFIIDGSRIYLTDQNDRVVALNLEGGGQIWNQGNLLHRALTSPVFYKGFLIVADAEGYVHWMNPEDGSFVAQQSLDSDGFLAAPVVADENLLLQSRSGKIYAFSR